MSFCLTSAPKMCYTIDRRTIMRENYIYIKNSQLFTVIVGISL